MINRWYETARERHKRAG